LTLDNGGPIDRQVAEGAVRIPVPGDALSNHY
jgi:hypothetical protein